jgi:hypothetical protein
MIRFVTLNIAGALETLCVGAVQPDERIIASALSSHTRKPRR